MSSTRPGFTGYVSGHRFRSALLACALALAAMLMVVYATVGFTPLSGPSRSSRDVVGAPPQRSRCPAWPGLGAAGVVWRGAPRRHTDVLMKRPS
jgi:hypothetical protein